VESVGEIVVNSGAPGDFPRGLGHPNANDTARDRNWWLKFQNPKSMTDESGRRATGLRSVYHEVICYTDSEGWGARERVSRMYTERLSLSVGAGPFHRAVRATASPTRARIGPKTVS
jgi:hypothetical protein